MNDTPPTKQAPSGYKVTLKINEIDYAIDYQPQLSSANDTAVAFCREKSSVLNLSQVNFSSCVEPVAAFLSNSLTQLSS